MILGFGKAAHVLWRLSSQMDFGDNLRILDGGCGPGTGTLSLLHFFGLYTNSEVMFSKNEKTRNISVVQFDSSQDMLAMARELTEGFAVKNTRVHSSVELSQPLTIKVEPSPEEERILSDTFDIILLQDVLGEMRTSSVAQKSQVLLRYCNALKPGGICIVIEKSRPRRIQEFHQMVSKTAEDGAELIAPCSRLFDEPLGLKCYSCSASSHIRLLRSQFVEQIAKASKVYDFQRLDSTNSWSYAVFGKGVERIEPSVPSSETDVVPLSGFMSGEFPADETSRYTIVASVAECDAKAEGVYRLCDQSCGAEAAWLHLDNTGVMPLIQFADVLIVKGVLVRREEIIDEGIVRIHFHADSNTVVENLSYGVRHLTFDEFRQRDQ